MESSSPSILITTLQDALIFDTENLTRSCDDWFYADRRLKYFDSVVLNMSAAIPIDDINGQIALLQEIKAMMQQLKITIPSYSGELLI